MKLVGAHVSAAGGVQNAPLNAREIGAKAFALFTKNQRQWKAPPLDQAAIDAFKSNMQNCGFNPDAVLPHNSYLINLGTPDPDKRKKSLDAFIDELRRCEQLGLRCLNIHPGSHTGLVDDQACLKLIAGAINTAIEEVPQVRVVLENTAGTGSNMGYRFEHLRDIIDQVDDKRRMGVCLDTCHAFSAGYDLSTKKSFNEVMAQFDTIIGLDYLCGMHLNDSKTGLGSRKDRHHSLGEGHIPLACFKTIMADKRFDGIPLILETIDQTRWPEEIRMLYSMV